ncbi:RNA polymerase II-associated protein 1 [Cyberlindnera fabianii]|uniref:RNA polymerase II-associated protein 1 n=1 Tax=Cyberlindnera fabianii TaxID=36022 RepID=A0A1V2L7V7_CYBFA|nr:RNA polymerase II-associated protein 1 [Cyberlindnera fabianii]
MSKNQDYIARVRYQNDLPPPLLPPKLLKYDGKPEEDVRSSSVLSSLFRKENVNNIISLDNDLGMPIDVVTNPSLFDLGAKAQVNHKLHPEDRVLLRDPQVERIVKNQPAVAFLRRTEYLGSSKAATSSLPASRSATPSAALEDNSPASQLRSIEKTFDNSTKTIKDPSTLKHPLKKQLKAKRVWSLLPDISRMDQKFATVKFASSSLSGVVDPEFRTALYRKMRLQDIDWVSFYTTDSESSIKVKRTLDDLNENIPKEVGDDDNDDDEKFRYTKRGDFDLKFTRTPGEIQEFALRFDQQDGIAYYNPISERMDLKRRKIQESHRELLEQTDLDEIDIRIREPTVAELNKRNTLRHLHDSVTYEAIETRDESQEPEELDDLEELRPKSDS